MTKVLHLLIAATLASIADSNILQYSFFTRQDFNGGQISHKLRNLNSASEEAHRKDHTSQIMDKSDIIYGWKRYPSYSDKAAPLREPNPFRKRPNAFHWG